MGQSTPIKRRACVLLVEDEWLISHMVAQALTDWGFSVHAFSNAEDALDWINSGAAVDLLFTDINLPGHGRGRACHARPRIAARSAGGLCLGRRECRQLAAGAWLNLRSQTL